MDKNELAEVLAAQYIRGVLAYPAEALPHIDGQPPLTANEKHAVSLAVRGYLVKDIARLMKTSTNTAGSYLKRVRGKTGIGKAELAPFILGLIRKELS